MSVVFYACFLVLVVCGQQQRLTYLTDFLPFLINYLFAETLMALNIANLTILQSYRPSFEATVRNSVCVV